MALSYQQAREVAITLVQTESAVVATSKRDLIDAVQAIDGWLTTMEPAMAATLPQPFKGASTPEARAALVALVAQRRWKG